MTPEQLKASILQMAIQGKLVEQRAEEGTAEELYQQIQKERKKYKIKEFSVEDIDDVPFDIPETWKWIHLQDIVKKTIKRGKSPKYAENSNVQVFAQKCNVKTGGINMELALFLDEASSEKYPIEEYMCDGDIVINSTGGGTMGRVGVFHDTDRKNDMAIVPDGHVTVIRACDSIDYKYLYYFIKYNQKYLETQGEGSTNQTELKPLTIASLVLPLPPLEEQHRIVAKIEELLPYVDRYAEAYEKLEQFNAKFPEDMKKSILQYAIQGKLVEQRSEEGTAEELYQQIQKEKQKLIKEGKIKKEKPLAEITEDEIPFDIPESWKWVRLGQIINFQGGYAFKSTSYVQSSENQVIRLGNVKNNNLLIHEKEVFVDDALAEMASDYKLKEDDILVTMTGTRRKKDYFFTLIVRKEDIKERNLYLNQRVGCFRAMSGVDVEYLLAVLHNEAIKNIIFLKETGTANQGNLGSEDMKEFVYIPLPPLNEQHRIVEKLKELLPCCDRLVK